VPCPSFLQIATADAVYVLDLRALLAQSESRALQPLTRRFLGNLLLDPSLLKVGWGFLKEDLRMLKNNAEGIKTLRLCHVR
jgi:hypothetical protein